MVYDGRAMIEEYETKLGLFTFVCKLYAKRKSGSEKKHITFLLLRS